jgi:catechol 2,3-dioxygenase-like lactoylglutathione lyase family enzyme
VFDHVGIWVSDRAASERFYRTVLDAIGIVPTHEGDEFTEWNDFALGQSADRPVTRRLHIGFAAPSRAAVDAFHAARLAAGYRDDGAPGPRPEYGPDYYGGFLLDPDGNSAEAVHHDDLPESGANIDHLWIRVADLEASVRFYDTIASPAGLKRGGAGDEPRRQQFLDDERVSFSLVAGGEPTEHLHFAFPTADDAAVHAFHATAIEAGYRDNGAPGERPEYHAGYYAAFVLDPDGNNVEVVNHHRP